MPSSASTESTAHEAQNQILTAYVTQIQTTAVQATHKAKYLEVL